MADHYTDLIVSMNKQPKQQGQLHIVMFPWLAFGHMIPYLELAKLMAAKGHRISFVSTTRNIDRLPEVPSHLSNCLELIKIQLNAGNSLPTDAEATTDIPFDKVQYLKAAYDQLQGAMADFLHRTRPDWILFDFTAPWIIPMAKRLDIQCAFFSIFISAFICVISVPTSVELQVEEDRTTPEQFTVPPKWIPFKTNVAYQLHEVIKMFGSVYDAGASGMTDMERFVSSIRDCDVICVRGCSQFDGEWIQLAEKLHGKPVIPVGQLPTSIDENDGKETTRADWIQIKSWLDQHPPASVIYASFGSEAKPSQEEVTELAHGLELCGMPFFWVLKTQRGAADKDVVRLPEGFEERIGSRGRVYTNWAPQFKILRHESVGGFLSHSGWSSVVEAMQCAQPLILVTFLADQGINARVLEEKKIGFSVPRRMSDGWFSRTDVAQSLKLVMVDEEGKVYRDKAREMSMVFGDRDLQDSYIDNLLTTLSQNGTNES